MDGTLLNSKGEISSANETELKRIRQSGIRIVLASGRPPRNLMRFCDQLGTRNDDNFTIAFNGSQIVRNGSGEKLHSLTLNGAVMKEAFLLSRELGVSFYTYPPAGSVLWYTDWSEYIELELNLVHLPLRQVDLLSCSDEDAFIKMTFVSSKEKIDAVVPHVQDRFAARYTVVRTHDNFLEILNRKANKGNALEVLCNHLGIHPEETLVFGDNDNDYEMFQYAHTRIAMENSPSAKLRAIATEIGPSNDCDGIAKMLKKYIG